MSLRHFAFVACGVLVATSASAAQISASAIVGYGRELDTLRDQRLDAYRFGVGARIGGTFAEPRIYLGVLYLHHFGDSESAVGPGSSFEQRHRNSLLGGELGYELAGRAWMLRPSVATGALFASRYTSVSNQPIDESTTRFFVAPGALFAYRIGPLSLGPEARVLIAPWRPASEWAVGLYATASFTF